MSKVKQGDTNEIVASESILSEALQCVIFRHTMSDGSVWQRTDSSSSQWLQVCSPLPDIAFRPGYGGDE